MTTLVDVSQDAGNSSRAAEALALETSSVATTEKPDEQKPDLTTTEDRRFVGKSREDILDMYRNLESHQGRLANELGQQRHQLNELLLAKRASDLQTNGQPATLTAADLLERPTEALDKVVSERLRSTLQPLEEQIRQLGAQVAAGQVVEKHGTDWEKTVRSSDFQSWAAKTPLRLNLVNRARQGDWESVDALLAEYKDQQTSAAPNKTNEAALRAASKVGLESTQAASDVTGASSGKKIRRQDLWALRVNDPERYDSMQPEILRAYAENRVVG